MINRATLQQVLSVKNSPSISKYYIALLFHVNSIPSLSKRLFVKFELVWQICSDTRTDRQLEGQAEGHTRVKQFKVPTRVYLLTGDVRSSYVDMM